MKKLQFLGLVAVFVASTAIASDNIQPYNDDSYIQCPYSIKLEAGVVMPASKSIHSKITGLKLKNKSSNPIGLFTFGYEIDKNFSVDVELGFTTLESSINKTTLLSAQAKNELTEDVLWRYLNRIYSGSRLFDYNNYKNVLGIDDTITLPENNLEKKDFFLIINNAKAKNQIKIKETVTVITALFGGNYNVYKDDCLKLYVGAAVGTANKKVSGSYETTIYKYNTTDILQKRSFNLQRTHDEFAYALRIGSEYSPTDNVKLHLAYKFQDLGKRLTLSSGKRSFSEFGWSPYLSNEVFKLEPKGKRDRLHIITAGISFNF